MTLKTDKLTTLKRITRGIDGRVSLGEPVREVGRGAVGGRTWHDGVRVTGSVMAVVKRTDLLFFVLIPFVIVDLSCCG